MCQHPVDMRNGINGLYKLVRSEMKMSPLAGSVFIFYGKNHQSVKLLRWDTDGFVLYQKRLEKGTFEIPKFDEAAGGYRMPWKTFSLIMQGVSLLSARCRRRKAQRRRHRKHSILSISLNSFKKVFSFSPGTSTR